MKKTSPYYTRSAPLLLADGSYKVVISKQDKACMVFDPFGIVL